LSNAPCHQSNGKKKKKEKVVLPRKGKKRNIKCGRLYLSSHGRQLPGPTGNRWDFAKDGISHILLSSAHIQLLESLDNNRHDPVANLVDFGILRTSA